MRSRPARCHLQSRHIPKFIPPSCPSKILDIGRAVQLLRHHPAAAKPAHLASGHRAWPRDAHEGTQHAGAGRAAAAMDESGSGGDDAAVLAAHEVTHLSTELQTLAVAPAFSGIAFEHTIDRLHEKVLHRNVPVLRFWSGDMVVQAPAPDQYIHSQRVTVRFCAPIVRSREPSRCVWGSLAEFGLHSPCKPHVLLCGDSPVE